MKIEKLQLCVMIAVLLSSFSVSAYDRPDTLDVAFSRGDTIFIEAEWYNPDSLTRATEELDGRTVVKPSNNDLFCYTLNVDHKSVYDFYFVSKYVEGDPYFFGFANSENYGDSRAVKTLDDWFYSVPRTDWGTGDNAYRNYRSMPLEQGYNNIKFHTNGGGDKMYVDYFILVPKQVYRVTEVPCLTVDTIKIEAEDYHPDHGKITAGKETVAKINDDYYVENTASGDTLVYLLNVGDQGGKFKVYYTYANPTGGNAWYRPYLNGSIERWGHYTAQEVSAIGSWVTAMSAKTIELLPGQNRLRFQLGYSGSQYIESITLVGTEIYGGTPTALDSDVANQLTVYPNPTTSSLYFSGETVVSATVFDFSGRQLLSQSVLANSLDVSSLSSGAYFINLTNEAGVQSVQRFVKQ